MADSVAQLIHLRTPPPTSWHVSTARRSRNTSPCVAILVEVQERAVAKVEAKGQWTICISAQLEAQKEVAPEVGVEGRGTLEVEVEVEVGRRNTISCMGKMVAPVADHRPLHTTVYVVRSLFIFWIPSTHGCRNERVGGGCKKAKAHDNDELRSSAVTPFARYMSTRKVNFYT